MEGIQFHCVDDLTPARDFWNMKARIIRVWHQSFRWDLILIDERGSKIQACVKIHLVKDLSDLLKEDEVVIIKKFGVGEQKDRHRVINLDKKINFFKCTTVIKADGFTGHPYGFNFIPFANILENNLGDAITVDVVGRIAWCSDLEIFKNGGKESRRVNLDLQDLSGQVLKVTLWGSYAEQCSSYIASNNSKEMVMVVLQHARCKQWGGAITVQNDMFGTRLFMNEDLTEANDLRRSLILKDGPSTSITVLSSQTAYPLRVEFVNNTPRKHVDEISEIEHEGSCVVVARIRMVEEDAGWFYSACRRCNKKAFTKTEFLEKSVSIPPDFIEAPIDSLWCLKCEKIATALVPKFKVQFRVQDSTGSVSFVMFDKDINKILGLLAVDVRERQVKSGEADLFPQELHVLHNKLFAFKIVVSKYNFEKNYNIYTVAKVCDDTELIAELQEPSQAEEVLPEEAELPSVKLDESSQIGYDSKDAASVTGNCLAIKTEKDSATSPGMKRPPPINPDETSALETSTARTVKKKLQA